MELQEEQKRKIADEMLICIEAGLNKGKQDAKDVFLQVINEEMQKTDINLEKVGMLKIKQRITGAN